MATTGVRVASGFLITAMTLAIFPVLAEEPNEDMRTFARMFVTLEARDLKGYCASMHGASYAGYLARVCQAAVQNKVKTPAECSQESIARQISIENAKCLATPAAEFEKTAQMKLVAREKFITDAKSTGIDVAKLLREERAKLEQTGAKYCEFSKGHVETLKSMLQNNRDSWSIATRTSYESDLVASEKEAATCCSDLDQCKRAFETPAKKKAAK